VSKEKDQSPHGGGELPERQRRRGRRSLFGVLCSAFFVRRSLLGVLCSAFFVRVLCSRSLFAFFVRRSLFGVLCSRSLFAFFVLRSLF
jgi:hypothetical protein